jgi:hypothetical protein
MTLAELIIHVQGITEMCELKGIRADVVEIYFVDNVLFDTPSGTLLNSKRPVTTLQFDGMGRQLLFFDPTSSDQKNRAAAKL